MSAGTLTVNTMSLQGNIDDNATLVFDQPTDGTYGGIISGSGGIVKLGAGTLTLTGANTHSGGTTIGDGALSVSSDANLGAPAGELTLDGGTLQYAAGFGSARAVTLGTGGGTVDTNANDATLAGPIAGAGALTKVGAGTLTLSGVNSHTGGTTVSAGTLAGTADSLHGNISNNATVIFDQATAGTHGGVITGTGDVIKQGLGALTLTGFNTYTGGTLVSAGSLLVNGTIRSVMVAPGAVLGGVGRVGPAVINGRLAPGNSIGTISTGSLTLNGIYEVELSAAGHSDRTGVTGTVSLGSTSRLSALADPGSYATSTEYLIIDNDGSDAVNGNFGSLAVDSPFLEASVSYAGGDGNDVVLQLSRTGTTFLSVAETPNQVAVAEVLTELAPTATGGLAIVGGELMTLSAPEVRRALDSLSGNSLASLDGFNTLTPFVDAVTSTYQPGPWVIGLGGTGSVDGDGNAAGYRSHLPAWPSV